MVSRFCFLLGIQQSKWLHLHARYRIFYFSLVFIVSIIVNKSILNFYYLYQGPLEKTVNDFWRMIWQEFVCKIVMAANIIEFGKVSYVLETIQVLKILGPYGLARQFQTTMKHVLMVLTDQPRPNVFIHSKIQKKCEKYWPDSTTKYGDILVTLQSESIFLDYTIRTFKVQKVLFTLYIHFLLLVVWFNYSKTDQRVTQM